jgi:hypothetical protein
MQVEMHLKASPALVVVIGILVVGAGLTGAFVLASDYLRPAQSGIPSLVVCPQVGKAHVAEACEVATLAWPTQFPCTGPAQFYDVSLLGLGVSIVHFVLQPYISCGGVLGRGLSVNVTEASDLHYAFTLDNGAPPVSWLNWTSPDGRVAVDWAATTSNVTLVVASSIFTISFEETGLPAGTNWSAMLAGGVGYSISNSILFTVGNGSYGFQVGAVSGYTAAPPSGIVTVAGADAVERVTFA